MFGARKTSPTHLTIGKHKYTNTFSQLSMIETKDNKENITYLCIDNCVDVKKMTKDELFTTMWILNTGVGHEHPWAPAFNFALEDRNCKKFRSCPKLIANCAEFLYDLKLLDYDTELLLILLKFIRSMCVADYPCTKDYIAGFLCMPSCYLFPSIITQVLRTLSTDTGALPEFESDKIVLKMKKLHFFGNLFLANCKLHVRYQCFGDPSMTASIIMYATQDKDCLNILKSWFNSSKYEYLQNQQFQNIVCKLASHRLDAQNLIQQIFDDFAKKEQTYDWFSKNDLTILNPYEWQCKTQLFKLKSNIETKIDDDNDSYINYYLNSKLASMSSRKLQNKVLDYLRDCTDFDGLQANLTYPTNFDQYKFAGPIKIEWLEEILNYCMSSVQKTIYGILISYYHVHCKLPPNFPVSALISAISPSEFTYIVDFLDFKYDHRYKLSHFTASHYILNHWIKLLINSNLTNDARIPIDWYILMHGMISRCKLYFELPLICKSLQIIWQTLECLYRPSRYGVYSMIDNEKYLTMGEALSYITNDKHKNYKRCKKYLHHETTYVKRFGLPSEKLHPSLSNIQKQSQSIPEKERNKTDLAEFRQIRIKHNQDRSSNDDNDDSNSGESDESDGSDESDESDDTNNSDESDEQTEYKNNSEEKPGVPSKQLTQLLLDIQRNKQVSTENLEVIGDMPPIYAASTWDTMSTCTEQTTLTEFSIDVEAILSKKIHQSSSKNATTTTTTTVNDPYPCIDIDFIHKYMIYKNNYLRDKNQCKWTSEYDVNWILTQQDKWLPHYYQYCLIPRGTHSKNRDWSSMPIWKTGSFNYNGKNIYSGVLGYFANYHDYVTHWSNDIRSYLIVRDGLLKTTNANWANMMNETLHKHINIMHVYWPQLDFVDHYQYTQLCRELTFLETITPQSIYDDINGLLTEYAVWEINQDKNKREINVFKRKLLSQICFLEQLVWHVSYQDDVIDEYLKYDNKYYKDAMLRRRTASWKIGDHVKLLSSNAMKIGTSVERIFNFKQDKLWDHWVQQWIESMDSVIGITNEYENLKQKRKSHSEQKLDDEEKKQALKSELEEFYNPWIHCVTKSIKNIQQIHEDPRFGPIFPIWINRFTKHSKTQLHWFVDKQKINKFVKKCLRGLSSVNKFDEYGYPDCDGIRRFRSVYYFTPVFLINNDNVICIEKFNLDTILQCVLFCTLTVKNGMFRKMGVMIQACTKWRDLVLDARKQWIQECQNV